MVRNNKGFSLSGADGLMEYFLEGEEVDQKVKELHIRETLNDGDVRIDMDIRDLSSEKEDKMKIFFNEFIDSIKRELGE